MAYFKSRRNWGSRTNTRLLKVMQPVNVNVWIFTQLSLNPALTFHICIMVFIEIFISILFTCPKLCISWTWELLQGRKQELPEHKGFSTFFFFFSTFIKVHRWFLVCTGGWVPSIAWGFLLLSLGREARGTGLEGTTGCRRHPDASWGPALTPPTSPCYFWYSTSLLHSNVTWLS